MPVQPTFPGIYIEELPSSTHTITAAPTSIAVFVGYTHPFKTTQFNQKTNSTKPIEIFSFTDYQRNFGGFFRSTVFDNQMNAPGWGSGCLGYFGDVAQAVNQFFLNGGADAYVVGLQPLVQEQPITPATATIGPLTFYAREIVDGDHQMKVTITNVRET